MRYVNGTNALKDIYNSALHNSSSFLCLSAPLRSMYHSINARKISIAHEKAHTTYNNLQIEIIKYVSTLRDKFMARHPSAQNKQPFTNAFELLWHDRGHTYIQQLPLTDKTVNGRPKGDRQREKERKRERGREK